MPLIPVDELPLSVRIQGVSRVLGLDQTIGMQHVGYSPFSGTMFRLEEEEEEEGVGFHGGAVPHHQLQQQHPHQYHRGLDDGLHSRSNSTTSSQQGGRPMFQAPDVHARQVLGRHPIGNGATRAIPHEMAMDWRRRGPLMPVSPAPERMQSMIDEITRAKLPVETPGPRNGYGYGAPRIARSSPPPSGQVPNQDKKEFCTYWIRTGECDYMQQGCLYRHEMPDRATLERIGFRTVPRWYLEKTAAVKLGPGKAGLVGGRSIKPQEWLKKRRPSTPSEEDDDNVVVDGEVTADESDEPVVVDRASARRDSGFATKRPANNTIIPEKTTTTAPFKTASSTAKPTVSNPIAIHRKSAVHNESRNSPSACSDLITLNSPLQTTSPPLFPTSSGSVTSQPRRKASTPAETPASTRVFVPRGENSESHIAEASRRRTRRGAPTTMPTTTTTKPNDASTPAPCPQQPKMGGVHAPGPSSMMASRHAPRADESREKKGEAKKSPVVNKNGCRVRRPAMAQ